MKLLIHGFTIEVWEWIDNFICILYIEYLYIRKKHLKWNAVMPTALYPLEAVKLTYFNAFNNNEAVRMPIFSFKFKQVILESTWTVMEKCIGRWINPLRPE